MSFMNPAHIASFRRKIMRFYRDSGRHDLPWRKTRDPYEILVSEVMLQQTQVSRVLQKYPLFLSAFPTSKTLAKAPLRRILSVWQGMGYNRRAIALKRIAEELAGRYGGKVPQDRDALVALPWIGEYTAGAILAFAFNAPEVFIETNIRRVYIHHFFPRSRRVSDAKLLPFVAATLDRKHPREWYYALMDYGSALAKKVPNPNRKSKHYAKQAPFRGSSRETRGMILKILSEHGSQTERKLKVHIPHPELLKNIKALSREGFLKERKGKYELA